MLQGTGWLNEGLRNWAALHCNVWGWGQHKKDSRRDGNCLSDPVLTLSASKLSSEKLFLFSFLLLWKQHFSVLAHKVSTFTEVTAQPQTTVIWGRLFSLVTLWKKILHSHMPYDQEHIQHRKTIQLHLPTCSTAWDEVERWEWGCPARATFPLSSPYSQESSPQEGAASTHKCFPCSPSWMSEQRLHEQMVEQRGPEGVRLSRNKTGSQTTCMCYGTATAFSHLHCPHIHTQSQLLDTNSRPSKHPPSQDA